MVGGVVGGGDATGGGGVGAGAAGPEFAGGLLVGAGALPVDGVAVIAAAPVGVTDPDGFVAAASCGPPAAAVLAGAPDASSATMAKVAVVLSPVASTRLAAAGRMRLVIESLTVAVRLTSLLHRLAQTVVTPRAVVGRGTRGRRRR